MIRMLARAALFFGASAIALALAALLLDNFTLSAKGFIFAVAIFALTQAILTPFLLKATVRNAAALTSAVGLIATLVSLIVTDLLNVGLNISGAGTWLLAALIVWLVGMIAAWLLPLFLFKKALEGRNNSQAA
ncbi:MAG: phage holin family protein [Nocardioidaceae bacterium]|nr:MAG: phage holin family protein [Nocardioidaceae bacterium]